jgi:hypothetical protein
MIGLLSLRLPGKLHPTYLASLTLFTLSTFCSVRSCFGHILRIASHRSCISLHSLSLWYLFLCKIAANLHIRPSASNDFQIRRVIRFLCRDTKPPHDSAKPRTVRMGVEARMRFLSSCHNSSFCTQSSMSFVQLM